jgi:hypothetical protein
MTVYQARSTDGRTAKRKGRKEGRIGLLLDFTSLRAASLAAGAAAAAAAKRADMQSQAVPWAVTAPVYLYCVPPSPPAVREKERKK